MGRKYTKNFGREKKMSCELCTRPVEKRMKIIFEDEICWLTYCFNHPKMMLMVLKRHTKKPTKKELEYLDMIILKFAPGRKWRYGGVSIPDHFHIHEQVRKAKLSENTKKLIIEGCLEHADEDLAIAKEFEQVRTKEEWDYVIDPDTNMEVLSVEKDAEALNKIDEIIEKIIQVSDKTRERLIRYFLSFALE